ncbi:TPA: phage tail protein [Yersinia enterocolitica]
MANEILPFGLGAESNVMTQAEYEALAARSGGFSSGVAKSEQLNKVWRQSSFVASVLADFIAKQSGNDVLDDGNAAVLLANLELAIKTYAGSNLPDASLTQKGVVQLSNSITSTSEVLAATPKAVKAANDAALQKSANLSDLQSTSTARTNLGLGGAAVLNVGTTVGTVAAGDDPRITASLLKANNLSDLTNVPAALVNLRLSDSAGFVGRLIGPPKIFTSSGTYTPTAGTTSVIVEAQGAGGGGGYARATSTGYMSAGSGGGAGGYGKSRLTSGFSGVAITIGSGGSQGVSGGDTSFGSLIVAAGGGGGSNGTDQYASGAVSQYVGASGGSCTGGNIINSRGGTGGNTITTTTGNLIGGVGGASHFTAAAVSAFGGNGVGVDGLLGCGGGGAISSSSPSSSFYGGSGGNGLVIIWEYA